MADESQSLTLESLLENAVQGGLKNFWTSLPGRVESFDSNFCTAEVQPMLWRRYEGEDGALTSESLPIVPFCPVYFQGGKGGRVFTPVAKGDLGLLVFQSMALDAFLATGNDVDPGDERRNTLTDAFFLPGVNHLSGGVQGVPSNYSDGAVVVAVSSGKKILLGSSGASDTVMRKSDAQLFLTALAAAITANPGPIAAALTALQTALVTTHPWVAGINSIVEAD